MNKKFSLEELKELFPGNWEESKIHKEIFLFLIENKKGAIAISYNVKYDHFYLMNNVDPKYQSKNSTSFEEVQKFYKKHSKLKNFQ